MLLSASWIDCAQISNGERMLGGVYLWTNEMPLFHCMNYPDICWYHNMFSHTSVLQSELKDTDLKTKAKLNTVLKIIFPIQSKFQTIGQLAPISQKFRGLSMYTYTARICHWMTREKSQQQMIRIFNQHWDIGSWLFWAVYGLGFYEFKRTDVYQWYFCIEDKWSPAPVGYKHSSKSGAELHWTLLCVLSINNNSKDNKI